jgi:hypothetical protein
MKTLITSERKRKVFQIRTDDYFLSRLHELAAMDRISGSDVIRILVLREHASRTNGSDAKREEKGTNRHYSIDDYVGHESEIPSTDLPNL